MTYDYPEHDEEVEAEADEERNCETCPYADECEFHDPDYCPEDFTDDEDEWDDEPSSECLNCVARDWCEHRDFTGDHVEDCPCYEDAKQEMEDEEEEEEEEEAAHNMLCMGIALMAASRRRNSD